MVTSEVLDEHSQVQADAEYKAGDPDREANGTDYVVPAEAVPEATPTEWQQPANKEGQAERQKAIRQAAIHQNEEQQQPVWGEQQQPRCGEQQRPVDKQQPPLGKQQQQVGEQLSKAQREKKRKYTQRKRKKLRGKVV